MIGRQDLLTYGGGQLPHRSGELNVFTTFSTRGTADAVAG